MQRSQAKQRMAYDQEEPAPGIGPPSPHRAVQNPCFSAAEIDPLAMKQLSSPEKQRSPLKRGPAEEGLYPTAAAGDRGGGPIDLDEWKGDLRRLHMTMDQAVQSFVANQTHQLDAVASELNAQKERIRAKEQCFNQLADSIAGFVETEATRTELWGLPLVDAEADARHEAYDAELPGPPALHRINRLWRKMTRAFEVMKQAKEREASKALSNETSRLEALVVAADERCEKLRFEHAAEVEALRLHLDSAHGDEQEKEGELEALAAKLRTVTVKHEAAEAQIVEMAETLEQSGAARNRADYEWEAEREELIRDRSEAQESVEDLQKDIESSRKHEAELARQCAERGEKLEQMKKIMDDQENEMTMKIERVQQYVKERQAGALVAEKKAQDSEKMCERWQREVQRVQAEKDRLANVVLGLETHKSGQAQHLQGTNDLHQQEVSRLHEALRRKEEEMRAANTELLQQREAEYQTKITAASQREKDRSIALLNKKQQELLIKEQQLKAARQRVQELESAAGVVNRPAASPNSSRGSSSAGRRPPGDDASLPPLPMSAR